MKGRVDKNGRPLLPLSVRAKLGSELVEFDAWVDTAFDGHFVFSTNLIKELRLETLAETDAILADGSKVTLQTYICHVDWFGETLAAEVFENDGKFPLLGTALMNQRRLVVDFKNGRVELS